ncbi:MAG: hypothetical protein GC160_12835 [Acidobacteria bacterium]|nr:hypothetical protein [Acidobacteriota bacterium]
MSFWARYYNTAALILAVGLQLVLLGYQVRRDDDMTLLRAWTMGAIAPINKGLHSSFDFVAEGWTGYVWLIGARDENEQLQRDLDKVRLENQELRRDLAQLQREQTLISYQERIASKTILAEVIGGGANANSKEIILNRGRRDGVLPGMAIVVADGIVGKVLAAYPGSALALLIDDADSGAGVILADSRVRGLLRGQGERECLIDYVEHEVKVSIGEEVLTSGEDRIFPKGLPVGRVTRVESGTDFQEIYAVPYAPLDRLDEVLVIVEGVHEELPPRRPQLPETLLPLPPLEPSAPGETLTEAAPPDDRNPAQRPQGLLTDADRIKKRYRDIAASQGVRLGEAKIGAGPPDFNAGAPVEGETEPAAPTAEPAPAPGAPTSSAPAVATSEPQP